MAFEGLLTKLGPTVVRELTPHVVQLVGGLAERFRKDTGEMKAAVDSEIAALGALQQETNARVRSLGESGDAMRLQLITLEGKLDRLAEQQGALAAQVDSLALAVRSRSAGTPAVLWAVLATSLAGLGVAIAMLISRH